ncbi:hypothetical protein [Planctomyces sp. SH-PL62]|uniref:hypothetical protein n=1 Tax=Planctomyces sp. SH-PL62 TaxID=1636152 RepID=UPI00078BF9B3|nr:hypothetical protein [Planctomyces sp. SH-PL62]AMV36100.1 hypothetical protein VT85_01560 [Planctomyces sp. SH-PL62]
MVTRLHEAAARLAIAAACLAVAATVRAGEPDFETAKNWFPPMRNVWTPVGEPGHPFRFNVLYDGSIAADPHPLQNINGTPIKTYLNPFVGKGVMLTLTASPDGNLPPRATSPFQLSDRPDGGVGLQAWDDAHAAPLLQTRWPMTTLFGNTGVVVREEVFAHVPGGGPVRTGREPIYLWMRLEIEHVDPFDAASSATMMIHLGDPTTVQRSMWHELNLTVDPARSAYPRALTRDSYARGELSHCRLVEPDGRIRLVAMTTSGSAMLIERPEAPRDYFLQVAQPAKAGNRVDILLPMIPGDPAEVRAEADLGFDAALAEADAAWTSRPASAATIDTPEPQVNRAVRRTAQLARVVSETNPENGERALLTGSWNYDTLWPTPSCMASHMLMDYLGWHEFTAENLEIFRTHQGTVKPPGASYSKHPGYFGAPRNLSSVDWLTDHGAVLHAASLHALLTDDEAFVARWIEPILKACAFLKESRARVDHDGVRGVLPPAVATDSEVVTQAVWNIAWNYKGLDTAVRLLRRLGRPEAEEYAREADEAKAAFLKAFREAAAKTPTWTDDAGATHPVVPSTVSGPDHRSHPFFLDAGPLVLVYAGLVDADDPLIQSALAFYREGPNVKLYDPRGNMHQRAVLTHEISSCEPCYSFNILCSWRSGDRARFLEGTYALLSGAISQQTFSGCEHRHGIFALPAPGALMFYAMRLSVVDDALEPEALHLLRLTPAAWIVPTHRTRFENMPTEYGPVDLTFGLTPDGKTLDVTFAPRWRRKPGKVVLHAPPVPGVERILVNGEPHPAGDVELAP